MCLLSFLADYSFTTILILATCALAAGFIDAVVGGGGLIQVPATLIQFPTTPLATIFGTNKIASLCGTSVAAYQYAKKIKFHILVLFVVALAAFVASYAGAKIVSIIPPSTLKPFILFILIAIAIYTFLKKDLGKEQTKNLPLQKMLWFGAGIGLVVGFYDGFFGPGTGSFFVLGFVVVLGFDFLHASAYAKIVNCVTNVSALTVFIKQGNYILDIAILMAVCNVTGNFIGSKMAIKKGNGFVRNIFLFIVVIMIIRYGYDVFLDK
jgi:uncharacterized membrane protein YfcA